MKSENVQPLTDWLVQQQGIIGNRIVEWLNEQRLAVMAQIASYIQEQNQAITGKADNLRLLAGEIAKLEEEAGKEQAIIRCRIQDIEEQQDVAIFDAMGDENYIALKNEKSREAFLAPLKAPFERRKIDLKANSIVTIVKAESQARKLVKLYEVGLIELRHMSETMIALGRVVQEAK